MALKRFLKFLLEKKYIQQDFQDYVPSVKLYSKTKVPSTLTIEQKEKLLQCIDRGNPTGKRDYAILLLASELELRTSDIRNLCFENLDWRQGKITLFQQKTGNSLELPLPCHISNAIIDYLKHGRPHVSEPYIFLKHRAPYHQYRDMYNVIKKALTTAQIPLEQDIHKGLHLLRHTLATNLLSKGIALSTIAEILGQRNITSTEIYLHTDIEKLRKCALDPEELING